MAVHNRELVMTGAEQLKAISDPTRTKILQVLDDRPASAKQLAELLGMTHGKVGHHLKVLKRYGLIEVVEERPVRAMTEKFYGLTYDRLRIRLSGPGDLDPLEFLFEQAAREVAPGLKQPFAESRRLYSVRMPEARAAEFAERLETLADEFAASSGEGPMFGLAAAVYRTSIPGSQL
ncbi:MAG: ArsR/SmtB family transcription factor [Acidimicrobiia bacterium]